MRRDDLIILSNGEKFNPLATEGKLISHPWVSTAYITGRGRFQVAALFYPDEKSLDRSDIMIIDNLWPAIEDANKSLPAFAQIHRDFVKIVRTPFPRTPKGTLARNETERLFAKDIENIYESFVAVKSSLNIDGANQDAVRAGIREGIQTVSGIKELEDNDNIFTRSFDSLHVIRLARLLKSAFDEPIEVEVGTIYANPSISLLGNAVWTQLHQGHQKKALNLQTSLQMLTKHSPYFEPARKTREYVIITGTTGSIGPYLLHTLCKNTQVAKIWCFNRSQDAPKRQVELARTKGFLPLNWGGKVQFIQHDPTSEALGLDSVVLQEIKDQATIIIRECDMSLEAKKRPRLTAISR